jgi:hypothetical protein
MDEHNATSQLRGLSQEFAQSPHQPQRKPKMASPWHEDPLKSLSSNRHRRPLVPKTYIFTNTFREHQYIYISGWWYTYPSEKSWSEFVSWDDDNPIYEMGK